VRYLKKPFGRQKHIDSKRNARNQVVSPREFQEASVVAGQLAQQCSKVSE
jgi:hypothetical protein